jgi:hypothetical protein
MMSYLFKVLMVNQLSIHILFLIPSINITYWLQTTLLITHSVIIILLTEVKTLVNIYLIYTKPHFPLLNIVMPQPRKLKISLKT